MREPGRLRDSSSSSSWRSWSKLARAVDAGHERCLALLGPAGSGRERRKVRFVSGAELAEGRRLTAA